MVNKGTVGWGAMLFVTLMLALVILLLTAVEDPGTAIGLLLVLLLGASISASAIGLTEASKESSAESTVGNPDQMVSTTEGQIGNAEVQTTDSQSAKSDSPSLRNWFETAVAAATGVVIVLLVSQIDLSWPALAIGIGAVATAAILFLVNDRTYYAGGGTLFCLIGAGVMYAGIFPEGYSESPFAVMLVLGGISALIVAVQLGIGLLLKRALAGVTGEETAFKIYEAVAAILGLIGMIWAVMNIHERATRYGGVTIGGTLGLALNFLGIELPIPWIIAEGVDAALVMYVGAVLIGFHTLESLHTTWRATKETAKTGANVGRAVGGKASETVSKASTKMRDE